MEEIDYRCRLINTHEIGSEWVSEYYDSPVVLLLLLLYAGRWRVAAVAIQSIYV